MMKSTMWGLGMKNHTRLSFLLFAGFFSTACNNFGEDCQYAEDCAGRADYCYGGGILTIDVDHMGSDEVSVGFCTKSCSSDEDCTDDFGENAECTSPGYCVIPCQYDAECASEYRCDRGAGLLTCRP